MTLPVLALAAHTASTGEFDPDRLLGRGVRRRLWGHTGTRASKKRPLTLEDVRRCLCRSGAASNTCHAAVRPRGIRCRREMEPRPHLVVADAFSQVRWGSATLLLRGLGVQRVPSRCRVGGILGESRYARRHRRVHQGYLPPHGAVPPRERDVDELGHRAGALGVSGVESAGQATSGSPPRSDYRHPIS